MFFLSLLTGLREFSPLVFLLSYAIGLGGFSPIAPQRSFGFPPRYASGLGGFLSIDLVFFLSFLTGLREFSPLRTLVFPLLIERFFSNRLATSSTYDYTYPPARRRSRPRRETIGMSFARKPLT